METNKNESTAIITTEEAQKKNTGLIEELQAALLTIFRREGYSLHT